jgi:hypothetical protein
MSAVVRLEDVFDATTGASGIAAVLERCRIVLRKGRTKAGTFTDAIDAYEELPGGRVALPLAEAIRLCPTLQLRTTEPHIPKSATRRPKPDQEEVIDRMLECLNRTNGVMLDCDPGMGKTFQSLYVGLAYRLPIAVIVARAGFGKQWANELCEIHPVCATRICLMSGSAEKDCDPRFTCTPANAHYLVIRPELIKKLAPADAHRYGYIIIDETQMIGTNKRLQALLKFTGASYVVGCSGTPEKPDNRHAAVECFLGNQRIIARRARPIDFVLCDINCYTEEEDYARLAARAAKDPQAANAQLAQYGRMEISLATDTLTNNRIAFVAWTLAVKLGHKILVLSKFTAQCKALADTLAAWGLSSTEFTGSKKDYNGQAQVTIGTTQVAMTAFDQASSGVQYDRRFTAALLCQSLSQGGNLWQGVGRVMRAPDTESPIFVWVQYPMKVYHGHRAAMVKEMQERGLRVLHDHETIISPESYKKYLMPDHCVEIVSNTAAAPPHIIYEAPV